MRNVILLSALLIVAFCAIFFFLLSDSQAPASEPIAYEEGPDEKPTKTKPKKDHTRSNRLRGNRRLPLADSNQAVEEKSEPEKKATGKTKKPKPHKGKIRRNPTHSESRSKARSLAERIESFVKSRKSKKLSSNRLLWPSALRGDGRVIDLGTFLIHDHTLHGHASDEGQLEEDRFRFPSDFKAIRSIVGLRAVGPWLFGLTKRGEAHVFDIETGLYRGEMPDLKHIEYPESSMHWDSETEVLYAVHMPSRESITMFRLNRDGKFSDDYRGIYLKKYIHGFVPKRNTALVAGKSSGALELFDLRKETNEEIEGAVVGKGVLDSAFSPLGQRAAIIHKGGEMTLVDLLGKRVLTHIDDSVIGKFYKKKGYGFNFGEDPNTLFFSARNELRKVSIQEIGSEWNLSLAQSMKAKVRYGGDTHAYGSSLWVFGYKAETYVFDSNTLEPKVTKSGEIDSLGDSKPAFSASLGEVIHAHPRRGSFHVWDASTATLKLSYNSKKRPNSLRNVQSHFVLNHDGKRAISADLLGAIRRWDIEGNRSDRHLISPDGIPSSLRLDPTGLHAFVAYGEKGAQISMQMSGEYDFSQAAYAYQAYPSGVAHAPNPEAIWFDERWVEVDDNGRLMLSDAKHIQTDIIDPNPLAPWKASALSKDGRLLLFTDLSVQAFGNDGLETEIFGKGVFTYERNADRLLLREGNNIRVVNLAGKVLYKLSSNSPLQHAAISGDGKIVCGLTHDSKLVRWDLTTTKPADEDQQSGRSKVKQAIATVGQD